MPTSSFRRILCDKISINSANRQADRKILFRRFPSAFSRRGGERGVSSPPPASPARTARRAGCKFRFDLRKSRNCREYFLFLRKFQRLWNRNSFYTIRFPAARRSSCRWLRPVWACTSAGRRSTAILIWGHARPAVTFDLLFRYLQALGYKVRYVRNITDVGHLEHDADDGEDKITKKARLEQLEPMEVAHYYTERYHRAMDALGVLSPSIEPRASGHIIRAGRPSCRRFSMRVTPTSRTDRSISMWRSTTATTATASFRGAIWKTSWPTRARWTGSATNATAATSRCGKRRRPNTSCAGLRRGATGSPAGTWSARP